jgi:hypothetical protein
VSVDTNVKGKNLAPYRKLRHDGLHILVTPALVGLAESMRVVAAGRIGKSLKVEFRAKGPVEHECGDGVCHH